jgi:hypothetical protein
MRLNNRKPCPSSNPTPAETIADRVRRAMRPLKHATAAHVRSVVVVRQVSLLPSEMAEPEPLECDDDLSHTPLEPAASPGPPGHQPGARMVSG